MPPVTSNWNLEAMPWKITSTELSKGGIMQFTAHAANQNMHQRMFLHQKRKSEMNPLLLVINLLIQLRLDYLRLCYPSIIVDHQNNSYRRKKLHNILMECIYRVIILNTMPATYQ